MYTERLKHNEIQRCCPCGYECGVIVFSMSVVNTSPAGKRQGRGSGLKGQCVETQGEAGQAETRRKRARTISDDTGADRVLTPHTVLIEDLFHDPHYA